MARPKIARLASMSDTACSIDTSPAVIALVKAVK